MLLKRSFRKDGMIKTSGTSSLTHSPYMQEKHTLRTLRIKFFNKYKKFMRLHSYFENLSKEELVKRFQYIGETIDPSENLYERKVKGF